MPTGRANLGAIALLAALGIVLAGLAFATPTDRWVAHDGAYSHKGTFSYRAKALKADTTYPGGYAVTGQPLFTKVINTTDLRFRYRFVSKLPHAIHGTIELKALILSPSADWQNLYPVEKKTSFSGDVAATGGPLELKGLYVLLDQLAAASGVAGGAYSVDIQPIVHIVGTVGGKPIDTTFSPVLPFTVTPTETTLDVATTAAVPGATYTPPTRQAALGAVINPVQAGSIPRLADNTLSFLRYQVPVRAVRLTGILLLALALALVLVHTRLLRRWAGRSAEEQIAARLGCLVTPVDARVLPPGLEPTPVRDFTSLAELSRYLERPIMRLTETTGTTYAVDDDTRVYEYHDANTAADS